MHKLSKKDQKWLAQFATEYICASFNKNPKKRLHKTDELKKSCEHRNNARNRDILSRAEASGNTREYAGIMKEELGIKEDYESQDPYKITIRGGLKKGGD